jgi:hypothetical protein
MTERLLLDQHSGWDEYLVQDAADESRYTIEMEADVEPVVERNKRLYDLDDRGYTPSRSMQHVASFPPIVIEIFKQRYGADPLKKGNEALLNRLLNDPDLRFFRTAPGWI